MAAVVAMHSHGVRFASHCHTVSRAAPRAARLISEHRLVRVGEVAADVVLTGVVVADVVSYNIVTGLGGRDNRRAEDGTEWDKRQAERGGTRWDRQSPDRDRTGLNGTGQGMTGRRGVDGA